MKSILVLLMLVSPHVFATKARINSLQGARFLTDTQFFFENPAQMMKSKNLLVFEAGGSTAVTSDNVKSEGGIFKEFGNGRGGLYLGYVDPDQSTIRSTLNNTLTLPENPVHFFYGQNDWAASLGYSKSDKGTTGAKQEYLQASVGIDKGDMEAWANIDLVQSAKTGTLDYKGAPGLSVGGEKHLPNNLYVTGEIFYYKTDIRTGGTDSNGNLKGASVTLLDRSIKASNYAIYYGPGFNYSIWDMNGPDIEVMTLPVYIGVQYALRDWLELRSSISQNFFLGSTKNETATPPGDKRDTLDNNTTVTVGAGATWKQLVFDATFAGSTNGQMDGNSFLANGAISFNF